MNSKLIALFIAIIMICSLSFIGCGGYRSATSQILEQTHDPVYVAKAGYYDALKAYQTVQKSYLPVVEDMKVLNPDLAEQIRQDFQKAWDILKDWKAVGSISANDKEALFDTIYKISMEIAKRSEE